MSRCLQGTWRPLLFLLIAAAEVTVRAAENPPKRAKPPVWTRDVLDLFFEDAREHLVGERPARPQAASAESVAHAAAQATPDSGWSQLVDGETLADEVKRIVAGLGEPLANTAKFKAGGYEQCRADFSVLAVLFGVTAEHDGDVRWKADAAALRDALARAGRNCKTATDRSFAEAAQRKAELEDVVRGERLAGGKAAELESWSELAERELLMKRMELAMQERISPALGNAREFSKRAADVRQEAELLAMLADIIQREEYDYWDDEAFRAHAEELRGAAKELTRAAIEANYEAARAAAGKAGQACSVCHEEYRG